MRKQQLLFIVLLFFFGLGFAQTKDSLNAEEKARREKNIQVGNPFKKFGYKPKIATLSKGKYLEFHDLDSIVKIGSFSYHVKNKSITGYTRIDPNNSEAGLSPEVISRWMNPDPLSEEFPSWSPYNFVMNNPIRFTDPTGLAPEDIIVTSNSGKELFRLDDGKTEITTLTARQLYNRGIQWFESTADNYMPLISKADKLSTFSELKHFSWNEVAEFAEVDRWMLSYRQGGSGDWKADGKPCDGYLMVTVDGEPFWTDAVGQIPFAVDKFTDELESTGSAETARQRTIQTGQDFGDGEVVGGQSDNSNGYDNAMIRRAINWAAKRYNVIKGSGWFGDNYDIKKTNHSPSNLLKQSNEEQ